MIQYLPMIASLVGAGYGAIKEGQQRRAMQRTMNQWNADNESLFNKDYYGDYTKRADVQSVIKNMRDEMKKQNTVAQNTAAVTGASPEAVNAQKERSNTAMSKLYSGLAAQGQQFKDRAQNRYEARKQQLQGMQMQTDQENANSSNNLLYNGLSSLGKTDWASILKGSTKPKVSADSGTPVEEKPNIT